VRRSLSRRRLLAAGVPALLAGCLVESERDGTDSESDGDTDEADGGAESPGDGASDSTTDRNDDGQTDAEQADDAETGPEDAPEPVGPDGSGLVVTSADVRGVSDDGTETTVDARLVVENRGRFAYGTVEFRVEAYATRPNSPDRSSVGWSYVTRRFPPEDRFADGTRRFETAVAFPTGETNVPSDPDWYEVDAVVRRADPI
jgi:hypothetical protein